MKNKEKDIDLKKVINVELIKKFMRDNNLSHKQFAKLCGIGVGKLEGVLKGRNGNGFNILFIASAMGISVNELIDIDAISKQL